jgi:two-component system OmpR family response regulator
MTQSVRTVNQTLAPRRLILVVEDDATIAGFLRRGLERATYEVDVAGNGNDVVEAVSDSGREYSAIVLDLMVPARDGLAIIDELRERGSAVKIMVRTARSSVEDRVSGLDHCCDK